MANARPKLASWSYLGYKKNLVGVVRINQVTSLDGEMSLQGPGWGKVKGLWEKSCFLMFFLSEHANVPKACSLHNPVCTR